MFLFEYEGKVLFREHGIPIPVGEIASSPDEAVAIARKIGYPVVLKPQIVGGRRGKAGAIRFANNDDELLRNFNELINMTLRGKKIEKILVEKKVDIKHEYYIAYLLDFSRAKPICIFSSEGGIEIEEIAEKYPEKLVKRYIDPEEGMQPYIAFEMLNEVGISGDKAKKFIPIFMKLWDVFSKKDLFLAEINPLVETKEGEIIAIDARVISDDNAEFRQEYIREFKKVRGGIESIEYKAKEKGIAFVIIDEEGTVGIIGNGAGLTLATVDVVGELGGKPANFLDIGGGARAERVYEAIKTLLSIRSIRKIFINIFGGITRCDEVARGIAQAYKELGLNIPLVVRLTGTLEDEGRKILEGVGIKAYTKMLEAAKYVVG
mgnify:CR=1 FL=1